MPNYPVKNRYSNIEEFAAAIAGITEAYSLRDNVPYVGITVNGPEIKGRRASTDKDFTINLPELFEAQQKLDLISTTDLKQFITTRAQSPAMAILKQLNII